jgi:ribosome-associated toxin RatA of RatAB toxin-antitoxin module
MTRSDITRHLEIAARPEHVWALTVDVERWPSLTPTISSVERLDAGPLRVGSSARVTQPKQRPAVWTVTELEPVSRFVWSTKVGPVTMTGGHRITPTPDGCTNTLTLELSGFGSRVLARLIGPTIRKAIETENAGFKAAAEAMAAERAS